MYNILDTHFNTAINHSLYWADWTLITYHRVREEFPEKTPADALEYMLERLRIVQRALGLPYEGEIPLRTTVARACAGVPELEPALLSAKPTCEGFFADLQAALKIASDRTPKTFFLQPPHDTNFVDRRFVNNSRPRDLSRGRGSLQTFRRSPVRRNFHPRYQSSTRTKKCFVCGKEGCWSTNHTMDERNQSRRQFFAAYEGEQEPHEDEFNAFLQDYEGSYELQKEEDLQSDSEGYEAVAYLTEKAFLHAATGEDIYRAKKTQEPEAFVLSSNYSVEFQGELWDTGAARVSTVGKDQAKAFVRQFPGTKIDWTPGSTEIRFGGDTTKTAIGTIDVTNPLGVVRYHILDAPTPFLFSLHDADRLGAYFNNVRNMIIQKDKEIPVVRKWGHPFFNARENHIFFIEKELHHLHRQFRHPRTEKLYKLLI